jgi:hypothetical protein
VTAIERFWMVARNDAPDHRQVIFDSPEWYEANAAWRIDGPYVLESGEAVEPQREPGSWSDVPPIELAESAAKGLGGAAMEIDRRLAERDELAQRLAELEPAAETLILSRAGWERWGAGHFLYDRHKGVGTGTVYSTADALTKITGRP